MTGVGEARFREMADDAPVMLWLADLTGECEFFNQQWLAFTGRTMAQEVGVGWASGVHFEDFQRCMATYLEAFAARRGFRMEYRLRRHDGEFRWILDTGHPRIDEGGDFLGFVGSCIDITEIREAQNLQRLLNEDLERRVRDRTAELERRLSERELLIREVHHRVKNNLQVISSLISMQSKTLEPQARAALEECQARIQTIALVHQRLYQAADLTHVPLHEYVRELVVNIHSSFASDNVQLVVDVQDLGIPIDKAIPCGLILNELITNALKHGFPMRRTGIITVRASTKGKTAHIVVHDDGIGFPAGFDVLQSTTLGFRVVTALVEQLDGVLTMSHASGTHFEITFPLQDHQSSP